MNILKKKAIVTLKFAPISMLSPIPLISDIQQAITQQILASLNHTIILCGDFNRDIALIGQHNTHTFTLPLHIDHAWRHYINTLHLSYVPTNTTYTKQGGDCFTNSSLIDGFYLNTSTRHLFHSHTHTSSNLNSNHFPVYLSIPPNSLVARTPTTPLLQHARLLNPIPATNLEQFNTKFFETNSFQLTDLITLLQHKHFTEHQWFEVCLQLDTLINNISTTIHDTCTVPPLSPLTP